MNLGRPLAPCNWGGNSANNWKRWPALARCRWPGDACANCFAQCKRGLSNKDIAARLRLNQVTVGLTATAFHGSTARAARIGPPD